MVIEDAHHVAQCHVAEVEDEENPGFSRHFDGRDVDEDCKGSWQSREHKSHKLLTKVKLDISVEQVDDGRSEHHQDPLVVGDQVGVGLQGFGRHNREGPADISKHKQQGNRENDQCIVRTIVLEVRVLLELRVKVVHDDIAIDREGETNEPDDHSDQLLGRDAHPIEEIVHHEHEDRASPRNSVDYRQGQVELGKGQVPAEEDHQHVPNIHFPKHFPFEGQGNVLPLGSNVPDDHESIAPSEACLVELNLMLVGVDEGEKPNDVAQDHQPNGLPLPGRSLAVGEFVLTVAHE